MLTPSFLRLSQQSETAARLAALHCRPARCDLEMVFHQRPTVAGVSALRAGSLIADNAVATDTVFDSIVVSSRFKARSQGRDAKSAQKSLLRALRFSCDLRLILPITRFAGRKPGLNAVNVKGASSVVSALLGSTEFAAKFLLPLIPSASAARSASCGFKSGREARPNCDVPPMLPCPFLHLSRKIQTAAREGER